MRGSARSVHLSHVLRNRLEPEDTPPPPFADSSIAHGALLSNRLKISMILLCDPLASFLLPSFYDAEGSPGQPSPEVFFKTGQEQ